MIRSSGHEAKAQGAADSARNPKSKVTSADAEHTLVEESKKAGGAAFHFDANATPAEKAAQARAVRHAGHPPLLILLIISSSACRRAFTTSTSHW